MAKNLIKFINIGFNSILLAFGLYFFLVKHNIAPGGVTGISLIMANLFAFFTVGQWSFKYYFIYYGFFTYGKRFW